MSLVINQLFARLGRPPVVGLEPLDEEPPISNPCGPTACTSGSPGSKPLVHVRDVSRVNGA